MSNKIELGCLVMKTKGKQAGRVGRVIEHDPTGPLKEWEWAVDIGFWERNSLVGFVADSGPMWARSRDLIRIDDYTEQTETQEQELTV